MPLPRIPDLCNSVLVYLVNIIDFFVIIMYTYKFDINIK